MYDCICIYAHIPKTVFKHVHPNVACRLKAYSAVHAERYINISADASMLLGGRPPPRSYLLVPLLLSSCHVIEGETQY